MSDLLTDAAERLFAGRAATEQGFDPALWAAVAEAGFAAALLPEDAGGAGTTVAEAMALLRTAAAHAAPIPLAETMLAGRLLALAGLAVPPGVLTLAPVRLADRMALHRDGGGWRLCGSASGIPWARHAAAVVVVAEAAEGPAVVRLDAGGFTLAEGRNLAGEPRDRIDADTRIAAEAAAPAPFDAIALHAAGAALRSVQIAGALAAALALSVQYAQTRVQFGRPIGRFQAIQHSLAILAGQSAAALAAADMATDALARALPPLLVGAAKARAGEAASIGAALAHQVHGAIGFTREYRLHRLTQRLWSWRDEFGNEATWQAAVGRIALAAGPDGLWPTLTAA